MRVSGFCCENRPDLYDFLGLLSAIRYGDVDGGFGGSSGHPTRTLILFLRLLTGYEHTAQTYRH